MGRYPYYKYKEVLEIGFRFITVSWYVNTESSKLKSVFFQYLTPVRACTEKEWNDDNKIFLDRFFVELGDDTK